MIGVYDSWVWGLATLEYFKKLLPEYHYSMLVDNAMFPLGDKTPEQIHDNTFKALEWFFMHWAKLVIIACNTATAHSVRSWQSKYPNKKVLSITIPGIEELIDNYDKKKHHSVGILATKATVSSGIYNDIFEKLWWEKTSDFECIISSDLISAIENTPYSKETEQLVAQYCQNFTSNPNILILWCTHFSLVKPLFEKYFNGLVIDPSESAAKKLKLYLKNHTELEKKLSKRSNWEFWSIHYYTTWKQEYNLEFLENTTFEKINL